MILLNMENMHQCIICLGSNDEAKKNLDFACYMLEAEFHAIEWGEAIYTPAEGTVTQTIYLNQGAKFYTDKNEKELKDFFKTIEKMCGRTSSSKRKERIPLDIDLLLFDGKPMKPDDLSKAYVKSILKSITD